jgi:hypothetical protein
MGEKFEKVMKTSVAAEIGKMLKIRGSRGKNMIQSSLSLANHSPSWIL